MHGDLGQDISNDGNTGQVNGGTAAEAPLQELRHGEYVGAEIERNEDPSQDQEDQTGQPFEGSDGQAGTRAGAGQSDEMFGRNVGNKERSPDGEPAHIATGQKVLRRGTFFSRKVIADTKNDGEVNRDDGYVYSGQSLMSEVHRGFAHIPPSTVRLCTVPCVMLVH